MITLYLQKMIFKNILSKITDTPSHLKTIFESIVEKENLVKMNNFSFFHNVFNSFQWNLLQINCMWENV